MQNCDLIISAPWVLPIAPKNEVLSDHAVAITNGLIAHLGPMDEIRRDYQATQDIHLAKQILLPGLVNAHGHTPMALLRGSGEDQALQDWLTQTIWPLEGRVMSEDYVALGCELAMAEMLSSGTTTFSDMYFFPHVVANCAATVGMRCQIAFPVFEMANAWSESSEDGLHKGINLYNLYRHHSLVSIAFGPHAPYTVNLDTLARVAMYANELDAGIQIHLHENAQELIDAHNQYGMSYIRKLADEGLLTPSVQAVHMTQLEANDFELFAASGASVIHCPSSNAKLSSGYCDISRFTDAGIRVGLGTDGAASNNGLDMFKEVHVAALLAKHQSADPERGNAKDMIHMATLGSANAMGMGDEIGSLEPGKAADLISVNINNPSLQPLLDPFATLIHGNCGARVDHVWVNGKVQLAAGMLQNIETDTLLERVEHWQSATF
ncbi:MAG: TRZ/ATZ family hydrolase [Pseudomonadota bacterium]